MKIVVTAIITVIAFAVGVVSEIKHSGSPASTPHPIYVQIRCHHDIKGEETNNTWRVEISTYVGSKMIIGVCKQCGVVTDTEGVTDGGLYWRGSPGTQVFPKAPFPEEKLDHTEL